MKKIVLTLGLYIAMYGAFAQKQIDSSHYSLRKLYIDEIHFISSYYGQDGNHSAVTGGIGTEYLNDFANTLDLKLSIKDKKLRTHALHFEIGIDNYTSASSDKIDPTTVSSASKSDTRTYPSLAYSVSNDDKRTTMGVSAAFSTEFDYKSFGAGINFSKSSKNYNREISLKLQGFWDTWLVIYPIELRPAGYGSGSGKGNEGPLDSKPRDSYSASMAMSQVINQRMQVLFIVEPGYQTGLLATKYQRVYFTDGSARPENLPDQRYKLPIGARLNYFLGDKIVIRSFYRYYMDSWGIKAHTIEIETLIKLGAYVSISPFYRFYTQQGAQYFSSYGTQLPTETYFTSDYDLASFQSQFFGTGIRIVPPNGVFGIHMFNSLELRYGHYVKSTGLLGNIITLHLEFK